MSKGNGSDADYSFMEVWTNKVFCSFEYNGYSSKDQRLRYLEEVIVGVGAPKQIRDQLRDLVCNKI